MADEIAGLLQELSGILRRISEQNVRKGSGATRTIDFEFRFLGSNNLQFAQSPLEFLQHHNEVLESLIERLKKRSKKG